MRSVEVMKLFLPNVRTEPKAPLCKRATQVAASHNRFLKERTHNNRCVTGRGCTQARTNIWRTGRALSSDTHAALSEEAGWNNVPVAPSNLLARNRGSKRNSRPVPKREAEPTRLGGKLYNNGTRGLMMQNVLLKAMENLFLNVVLSR